MLFFLACYINTHPSIPSHMEENIFQVQQHVQRIEDLSNQLLIAQQNQDREAMESLIDQLIQENTLLQEQKNLFEQSLKVDKNPN